MVSDLLSTSTDITILDNTLENNLAVTEERKNISSELEKKIYSITKGASTSAYSNYLKNMALNNSPNANIIYDFIITEQNHTDVKLSTRLSYIKVLCLFNRHVSYKDLQNNKK